MFQLFMCIFGFHGAMKIDHAMEGCEVQVYWGWLKKVG
jgi:hypothetical protein